MKNSAITDQLVESAKVLHDRMIAWETGMDAILAYLESEALEESAEAVRDRVHSLITGLLENQTD